ncbi:hypothetical protein QYM36_000208 [Artemia franciscana]|uniref:Uncharacterized protein n=1 Tax=Artemia franciscana TaxID=6661 RepID=A0AA88IC68_ARTSF|nr:hypothetical protein QYM36_000208 [Artemia franciscana]
MHSLAVVADNVDSSHFSPFKVPSDSSSDENDCVVVLKILPLGCDSSLNQKITLDTFFKKAAICKVFPSKDKLRVHLRTAEAAQQFFDEAAVLFELSTQAKIIPNVYLGPIRNYRADPSKLDR